RAEQDAAEDRVRRRICIGDAHDNVAAEIPNQILPAHKRTDRSTVKQCAVAIHDIDALRASHIVVPIEHVERDLMSTRIFKAEVDAEASGRVPAGGYAVAEGALLHSSWIAGGSRPYIGRVARGRHRYVRRITGRIVDYVGPLGAVSTLPGAL